MRLRRRLHRIVIAGRLPIRGRIGLYPSSEMGTPARQPDPIWSAFWDRIPPRPQGQFESISLPKGDAFRWQAVSRPVGNCRPIWGRSPHLAPIEMPSDRPVAARPLPMGMQSKPRNLPNSKNNIHLPTELSTTGPPARPAGARLCRLDSTR